MRLRFWLMLLAVAGPGLVVMLADTDAGSIILAAQSGTAWGYQLLPLQLILIPILYLAQELTVRLGLVTGMGHGELIKAKFGTFWAWLSVGTLLISCIGAMLSEFSGIAGVGHLFGISTGAALSATIILLVTIAWTGSYLTVERIALILGLFELAFVYVAFKAHPHASVMLNSMQHIDWRNHEFLYLAAGNIGAVIMPWMIFYQQSAVVDKKLTTQHLKFARWDTLFGAIITQMIMCAVLITTAAALHPHTTLNTVHEISGALAPALGITVGKLLFAAGMLGASLVAAIVVSLTAAWGLGEVMGYRRSLRDRPKEAPWFYSIYTLTLIIGGIVVTYSGINLVTLNVAVEVMNALLLPIVLGFLFVLAWKTLPASHCLQGKNAIFTAAVLAVTACLGLIAGLIGIFN